MDSEPNFTDDKNLTLESLVPRLGEYLVRIGKISQLQLDRALRFQKENADQGQPIRLGQALRKLEIVDEGTLDQAITKQLIQLHTALKKSNENLEQKVIERTHELNRALQHLTELNQVKSNFIANISHELRTPLTVLKGYFGMLEEDPDLEPLYKNIIGKMIGAEKKLENLIEELIAYTYADRGELILEQTNVKVDWLIKSCVQNIRMMAEKASIDVSVIVPDLLPDVYCDRKKIAWVIEELLKNAIKFTKPNGLITVIADNEYTNVCIKISDSGIGIPEERTTEIFEPFHQLNETSTRHYGGSGLGLTLAHHILAAHGINLEVHSKLNEGSCFWFHLPLAKDSGLVN